MIRSFKKSNISAKTILLSVVAAAMLLASCSGSDDSSDEESGLGAELQSLTQSSGSSRSYSDSSDAEESSTAPANSASSSTVAVSRGTALESSVPSAQKNAAQSADIVFEPTALKDRDVIYESWMTLVSDDVLDATDRSAQKTIDLGGYVEWQETSTEGRDQSTVVMRVPPQHLAELIVYIRQISPLLYFSMSAQDVTVDLAAYDTEKTALQEEIRYLEELLRNTSMTAEQFEHYTDMLLDARRALKSSSTQKSNLEQETVYSQLTLSIVEKIAQQPDAILRMRSWLAQGSQDACAVGSRKLKVDYDAMSVTMCAEIENLGDAALEDLEVSISNLDVYNRNMTIDDETKIQYLAPGELMQFSYEAPVVDRALDDILNLDGWRTITMGVEATVESTDAEDAADRRAIRQISARSDTRIKQEPDTSWPGFSDAWATGSATLKNIGNITALVIGFALPLVPVIALAALAAVGISSAAKRIRTKRRDQKRSKT